MQKEIKQWARECHTNNDHSFFRRRTFSNLHMCVKIRWSISYIQTLPKHVLVIESVQVEESMRRKGIFTRFLGYMERLALRYNRKVIVEFVLSDIMENLLKSRKNYTCINGNDFLQTN